MKIKIALAALIAICLSLTAYGSLAYFTAKGTAHNVITTGEIEIKIREWADEAKTEPFPETGVQGVMPGTEVIKIAEIENTGSAPAWVRVKIEKTIAPAEENLDGNLVKLENTNENWQEKDDGYWYYLKALEPGGVTEPVFTRVRFDESMGNPYQNAEAKVSIYAYATQAAHNGENVFEAVGWPEDE